MISKGSMSASRSGTRADVDVDPDAAGRGHLAGRGGQPGGAEVLERDEQVLAEQLQAALEQLRLLERVADLDRRPLRVVALVELGRGEHRGAADPVAPGQRPIRTTTLPIPAAAARTISSVRAMPTHIALTRQLCS